MTVQVGRVRLAGPGEAAALAAFLGRLLRWDRAAAVRLKSRGPLLAVFGQPAAFRVLAVRTVSMAATDGGPSTSPGGDDPDETGIDVTVSAGALLEGLDDQAPAVTLPAAVTGPPWAGVLPPPGGWRLRQELPWDEVAAAAAAVVAEFRRRSEALAPAERTRAALDALAEELWSRPYRDTELPLRVVHAAHALGFLRRPPAPADGPAPGAPPPPALLTSGRWLRLRTGYGSVMVRRVTTAPELSLTPLR